MIFYIASYLLLAILASASKNSRINDLLLQKSLQDGYVDVFVNFPKFDQKILSYAGVQEFGSKRQFVMEALMEHSEASQAKIRRELEDQNIEYDVMWIDNSIFVKKAPAHLMTLLVMAVDTGDMNVESLSPNRIVSKMPPPKETNALYRYEKKNKDDGNEDEESVPWNLKMIGAHKIWPITKGKGVVVANIDTGVDFLHPALYSKYRGCDGVESSNKGDAKVSHEYNWFDHGGKNVIPHDVHGHGTHTMGTMVGDGVGVAPEATWIAAQGCTEEGCSQDRLLASAQWVMCPTDSNGKNPRCDLGADIVNNSWGGEIHDDESMVWFTATANAWIAAGIMPVFAQGNSGPGCRTAGTPGDLSNVLGVGAIDENFSLSFFSSRGPGANHEGHAEMKPDLVAPGQEIVSLAPRGQLVAMSGTSMAAPHVAGALALMLAANPKGTFPLFSGRLVETANYKSLVRPQLGQMACFGKVWNKFPNFQYGHGMIDVYAAISEK